MLRFRSAFRGFAASGTPAADCAHRPPGRGAQGAETSTPRRGPDARIARKYVRCDVQTLICDKTVNICDGVLVVDRRATTAAARQRRAPRRGAERGGEGVGFDVDDTEHTAGSWEVYQGDKGAALAARSEEGRRGGGGEGGGA